MFQIHVDQERVQLGLGGQKQIIQKSGLLSHMYYIQEGHINYIYITQQ